MNETTPNFRANHQITRSEIILNIIVAVVIIIIGAILIQKGWNEEYYSPNEGLRDVANVITQMGSDLVYIILFCLLYFCYDKHFARRLILGFLATLYFTSIIKLWFRDPRPRWNIVKGEPIEESYGFPSGHSSSTVAFWGYTYLAFQEHPKKKGVQFLAVLLLITVPISRLILGVHDVQDVVGGLALGLFILVIYMALEPKFAVLNKLSFQKQIILGVLAAFALWGIGILFLYIVHPDGTMAEAEDLSQCCGIIFGFAIGFPIEEKYVKYSPITLAPKQKLIAGLVGVVIVMAVYFGMSIGLEGVEPLFLIRFIRYTMLAFTAALIVPVILIKICKHPAK